jgi:hypothetical protein
MGIGTNTLMRSARLSLSRSTALQTQHQRSSAQKNRNLTKEGANRMLNLW